MKALNVVRVVVHVVEICVTLRKANCSPPKYSPILAQVEIPWDQNSGKERDD